MANYIDLGVSAAAKATIAKEIAQTDLHDKDALTGLVMKVAAMVSDVVALSHPLTEYFRSYPVPVGGYIEKYNFESLAQAVARDTGDGLDTVSDLTTDYDFSKADADIYKRRNVQSTAHYFAVARQAMTPYTIEDRLIMRSFNNQGQMDSYMASRLLNVANKVFLSDFASRLYLFSAFANSGDVAEVKIETANPLTDDAAPDAYQIETGRKIVYQIMRMADNFTRPNDEFNIAKADTQSPADGLVLIVSPEFEHIYPFALMNIFNKGLVDIDRIPRFVVDDTLPTSSDGATKVEALLVDRRVFETHDVLLTTEYQRNPKGLYTNFWRHRWEYLLYNKDFNAVKISTHVNATPDPGNTTEAK